MPEGGFEPRLTQNNTHVLSTTTSRFAEALSKSPLLDIFPHTGYVVQDTGAHGTEES